MTFSQIYSVLRSAVDKGLLKNGDRIKIEDNQIFWSNDGGYYWETLND